MQVQVDVAGEKNDDSVNDLTKKTPIRITAKASYGGIENNFEQDSIDDSTENWSTEDYSVVDMQSDDNVPGVVTEYEDFEMHWTFKVKNSSGEWIIAYKEEADYSQKTVHKDSSGGKTYGLYLIYDVHKFNDNSDFRKQVLDYACTWANGKSIPDDIRNAFIEDGFSSYIYSYNCHQLSATFVRACLASGLTAKQHVWTLPKDFLSSSGDTGKLYDGPNNSWSLNDTCVMKSYSIGGIAYTWSFHAWAESGGKIYDPSAEAAGGTGIPNCSSWGAYEDSCFDKYQYVTVVSPLTGSAWTDNPSGQELGFNDEGVHVYHYEYDDSTSAFPEFITP